MICLRNNDWIMKKFLLVLLFFGFVSCQENSDIVLNKSIEVHGGTKNFNELRSAYIGVNVKTMGMEIPIKIFLIRPMTMRTEVSLSGQNLVTVLLPDTAFAILNGTFTPMPNDSRKQLLSNFEAQLNYFRSDLMLLKENGAKLTGFSKAKFRGKDAYKFRLEYPDKTVSDVFVDKNTFLNLGVRNERMVQGQKIETETVYSDYRRVGGFLVHYQTEVFSGKELIASAKVDSISINPQFSPKLFLPIPF